MASGIRRRDVIALVGGMAAACPILAHAQERERMRRVGVLMSLAEGDPEARTRLAGLREGLERLGWEQGRNLQIDYRFAAGDADRYSPLAKELIALHPEVIFTSSGPVALAVHRESRSMPIVFTGASDPIGMGLVESLARPGGNVTGFLLYEASIIGKWMAMLKEMAPPLLRVGMLGNPRTVPYDYYMEAAEAIAPSLALELVPLRIAGSGDIQTAIADFARVPNGGLVLPADSTTNANREQIVALAARHRLPALYTLRAFVTAGGLMSYDTDRIDQHRQAASYIDRILRGERAADLPVRAPTKYETVINLKTAKALGLTIPPSLLVAADEVIE